MFYKNDSDAWKAYDKVIQQTAETIEQTKKEADTSARQRKKKVKAREEPKQLLCERTENIQLGIESAWRGLTAVELRQGKPDKAVNHWEAFRGGRRGNPSPDTMTMAKGESLLVYTFLPGHQLSGWLINHDGDIVQRSIDRSEALRLAAEFSALAADREIPPESIRKSARALNDVLIAPFAKNLPPDNSLLVIDADGPLSSIPWAALEDSNGHALIERYALSQTAAWAEGNAADKDMQISKALIVSEPALGKSLQEQYPPLPEVQRETEEVRRRLPGAVFLREPTLPWKKSKKIRPDPRCFIFQGTGSAMADLARSF